MKKAGIIGGSGFIGSYVSKAFLDNGFEVIFVLTSVALQFLDIGKQVSQIAHHEKEDAHIPEIPAMP